MPQPTLDAMEIKKRPDFQWGIPQNWERMSLGAEIRLLVFPATFQQGQQDEDPALSDTSVDKMIKLSKAPINKTKLAFFMIDHHIVGFHVSMHDSL
ncbi:hypothetical protein LXL04_013612 [Taraxacum kok-saghyz]